MAINDQFFQSITLLEGLIHGVVLDNDCVWSQTDGPGVSLDVFGHTADTSAAAVVDTVADTASDFAALGIDSLHFWGHAQPE